MRKYIDELGVKERPDTWCPNDKREPAWAKQRDIYNFDSRETWDIELTIRLAIYERVRFYIENAPIDLSCHKIEYKSAVYTQEELIEELLSRIEFYISPCYNNMSKVQSDFVNEIEEIWAVLHYYMWW